MTPLHVLFGAVSAEMPGGGPNAEAAFVVACGRSGRIVAREMPYARRRPHDPTWKRALEALADLAAYAWRIVRERPDVVHLNTAFDHPALLRDTGYALISRALGQPVFLKLHGSHLTILQDRSPLWRALSRLVLGSASLVGVLSGEEKRAFVAAGWPEERFVVVKNAIDVERFAAATWPRPQPPELLFIARFLPGKGVLDAVGAARHLRDAGRAFRLTCVGDGPERAAAEALVAEHRLAEVVRFVGRVSEAETTPYYLRATMLIFPTAYNEGFSMTLFQSLAAGLPILTTRIRAAADWLAEPDHCLWVEAGDPEGIARRVGWLLDHPDAAAGMSASEREHARRFAVDSVVAEYADLYARVARRSRPSPGADGGTQRSA